LRAFRSGFPGTGLPVLPPLQEAELVPQQGQAHWRPQAARLLAAPGLPCGIFSPAWFSGSANQDQPCQAPWVLPVAQAHAQLALVLLQAEESPFLVQAFQ